MERLNRQIQETQKLLSDPETDWKVCSLAIEELATAVESLGRSASRKDAVRLLLSLSVNIGQQLIALRSKLVKDVCEHLLRIVEVTGRDFQDMANSLLPQIIGTAKSSSGAIRQPGSKLLRKMSEVVRYDLSLMRKIYVQLMQDKAHVLILEQLGIIFVYWSDEEVLQWESDVLEIIRRGLEDQNDIVRKTAREVLTRFSSRWSERMDELVDIPSTQSKTLLISEHCDSHLAKAILIKYPELADKSDVFARSRSNFTRSRASFRKSPRHKREQGIEIHVSAKQHDLQDVCIQETSITEVITSSGTGTMSVTERNARESSLVSRRLFDTHDFSDWPDDEQKSDIPETFDGSQMHGFQLKSTTAKTAQPLPPEAGNVPSPRRAISIQTDAAQSSSASIEEASLQHPGVRKLQESKIPSPLTRSPSLLNKKHLGSPTRATNSPERLSSQLPRPGSFILEARGSSGPSTPARNAKVEEEKAALSASDEYFSKPIPSSIATPTPPPPSTENVTLRPRRRGFVCQEQEDPSLQTYGPELSSPDLAASSDYVRPRQAEITLESVVCSSPHDQEARSPLRDQHHSGCLFDEEDDIGHLTEGSDHVESDSEWKHRRLDDSQSRSNSGFLEEEEADQSKPDTANDGDIFTNEWRLDEGPRHKFDAEDEIGDSLSDQEDPEQTDLTDKQTTIMNEREAPETEWHDTFGSSPQEYLAVQNDFEEDEAHEKDEELNTENTPNDALSALLNVRDEMTRLRAITRNEENNYDLPIKERGEPLSRYTVNTEAVAEESQERSPTTRTEQPSGKPSKEEPSYLQRLTHADRFARSPLIAPDYDSHEEKGGTFEQPSPLQTFEPALDKAAVFDDHHEQLDGNDFSDLQAQLSSSSPVFEKDTTKNDGPKTESIDFVKESQLDQESHVQDEQAGRFAAAEKLFAATETPSVHDYYGRPQSPHERCMASQYPEQEHYTHSQPCQPRYPAPTQMEAKFASVFATTQQKAMTDDVKDDQKDAPAVCMTEGDDAAEKNTPKPALKQAVGKTSPLSCKSVPSSVEPVLPAAAESKHGIYPTPPAKRPPNAMPEKSPPAAKLGWMSSIGISIIMLLSALFCIAGLLHAAKTVNESHEYHLDLKARIGKFESSIAESHKKMLKLEQDYAIWSEYVRKLSEEDEANALTQLQAIQIEVQKWQQDMQDDLVQFRQALSADSIEAMFAKLRLNNTKQID